ncbi:hypothetical protein [Spongiactinospora sp. 9N601]|uniref:hypothetical protein n=1 Tax=Spongiactinospora sp. 9N601 TaxID=3375149 RepID=UPI0037BCC92D
MLVVAIGWILGPGAPWWLRHVDGVTGLTGRDLAAAVDAVRGRALAVATAYAGIAARARYCAPTAIITGRDGTATSYRPECRQAIDQGVADAAAEARSGVFTEGTMRGAGGIGGQDRHYGRVRWTPPAAAAAARVAARNGPAG